MGFNFGRFIRNPVRAIVRVVKNPASKIIPHNIRKTKIYKKIGRPIIKVGAGLVLGALTGGVGLAGGAIVFSGLSAAGAVAGGVSSALAGGLNSKGFKPIKNGLLPAVSGLIAGSVARNFTAIKAATNAASQAATSAAKKEAARLLAKARVKTSPASLLKTAGKFAGSKLAVMARGSGSVGPDHPVPTLTAKPVTQLQAQVPTKNGNGVVLATLAVVAVSALAGS